MDAVTADFVTYDTVEFEIDIVSLTGMLSVVEVVFCVSVVVPTLVVTFNSIGVYMSSVVKPFLAVTLIAVVVASFVVVFSYGVVVVGMAGGVGAVV